MNDCKDNYETTDDAENFINMITSNYGPRAIKESVLIEFSKKDSILK